MLTILTLFFASVIIACSSDNENNAINLEES